MAKKHPYDLTRHAASIVKTASDDTPDPWPAGNHVVTHPWIIMEQPGGTGDVVTTLEGAPGSSTPEFALLAADLIRHIARRYYVKPETVLALIQTELKAPTTKIEGGNIN